MREESTVAEVDNRGRLQLPIPLRKALKIMDGGLVRVTVEVIEMEEESKSNSGKPLRLPLPLEH
jgi:bifunctional DNA-binding transcriptional regulator/antitoxin component of YhaV-PrlF toxin-antitoxin module